MGLSKSQVEAVLHRLMVGPQSHSQQQEAPKEGNDGGELAHCQAAYPERRHPQNRTYQRRVGIDNSETLL